MLRSCSAINAGPTVRSTANLQKLIARRGIEAVKIVGPSKSASKTKELATTTHAGLAHD
jgi:hypothetical protein